MHFWVEGVRFDQTIYDTDDISTIRGSSMILEQLGEALAEATRAKGAVLADFGASRAVLTAPDDAADAVAGAIEVFCKGEPWRHFQLIRGKGPNETAARAAARLAQLHDWSLALPRKPDGAGPDALDRRRPAEHQEVGPGGMKRLLSTSTRDRRAFGRKMRPNLFDETRYDPAASFEELVDVSGRMPAVVKGKLAVIVADGIGIGEFSKSYGDGLAFAKAIAAFRRRLGASIVKWTEDRAEQLIGAEGGKRFPRVDVLVWGGDDMVFALPASHAFDFITFLMEEVAKPFDGANGAALHHRIGCIIANHKVPIRQMRSLAYDAETRLSIVQKARRVVGQSMVSIDVFESAALPYGSLRPYREALYGPGDHDTALSFTRADFERFTTFLRETIGDEDRGLAVSQLHRALQVADGRALSSAGAQVSEVLKDHFLRRGLDFPGDAWVADHGAGPRTLPLFLALAAQLQPYAEVR